MNKLDSTQLEQLKAIGAYLYEVRQAQSRTLEEIAAKTYIPLRLLKALEGGQEQILPEPVFVQGFIRRYGDALGLDGLSLSQEFPITSSTEPEIKPDALDPVLSDRGNTATSEAARTGGVSMQRPSRSAIPLLASAVMALVVLGGVVYWMGRSGSPPSSVAEQPAPAASAAPDVDPPTPAAPAPVPSPSPVAVSPSAAVSPSPTASTRPSPAPNAPVKVDVNLTADSWLEVTVDGEIELSETLPRGTKRSWSAEQAVTIVAGNAGGVQVAFNQSKAQPMGTTGAVAERTFTATRE